MPERTRGIKPTKCFILSCFWPSGALLNQEAHPPPPFKPHTYILASRAILDTLRWTCFVNSSIHLDSECPGRLLR